MKQPMLPNAKEFYEKVYPCLSDEGKRKADLLLDEYAVGDRHLTALESREASNILVQIVKTHTVKEEPFEYWAPSWRLVLLTVALNTVVIKLSCDTKWALAFVSAWGAAAVIGILAALRNAFFSGRDTE